MTKHPLSLEHNIRPSATGTAGSPTIIMLHGYGSDENDLFSFASELPAEYTIISLRAPVAMQPFGYAWYPIYFDPDNSKWSDDEKAVESRDLIVRCLDEIIKAYEIDAERITLLGFSQGCILSFAVALSFPEKISRVVGLSGYINESILTDGYRENDFSKLKVYSSHGSVDQVIPVQWGRRTPDFLKSLGIGCKFSEFPVGHGVAPQNFYEFKEWLQSDLR